jgi:hypothetical protein
MTPKSADRVKVDMSQLRHEPLSVEFRARYLNDGDAARREAALAGAVDQGCRCGWSRRRMVSGVGAAATGRVAIAGGAGLRSCGGSTGGVGAAGRPGTASGQGGGSGTGAGAVSPYEQKRRPSRRPVFVNHNTFLR